MTPVPRAAADGRVESREETPSVVATRLPLELWRRLDWRFLLPDPSLGVVACGSGCDESLVSALRRLRPPALHLAGEVGWDAVPAGAVDVGVLVQPSRTELRRAVAALRPGGWLYVEVRRGPVWHLPLTWGLLGARRAARSAALEDVALHWHAPDITSSARIVPLSGAAAVRSTLMRHEGVRFGRLKSLVGRCALRLGTFPLLVPEGSLVARRPLEPVSS